MANLALMILENTENLPVNVRLCPEESAKLIQRVWLITLSIVYTKLLKLPVPDNVSSCKFVVRLAGDKSHSQISFINLNWCATA